MDSLVDGIVYTPAVESHKIPRRLQAGRLEAESKWAAGGESAPARFISPVQGPRPGPVQAGASSWAPASDACVGRTCLCQFQRREPLNALDGPKIASRFSSAPRATRDKTRRDSKQQAQAVSIKHPLRCPLSLHARPLFYFTARSQLFSGFLFLTTTHHLAVL